MITLNNDLKRLFYNDKGATSVLVVFLMIVLVTLGTFAITSALVNYRFAGYAADWSRMYYALEDQAERFTMEVDEVIVTAAERSIDYVAEQGYAHPAYEDIPQELQLAITKGYAQSTRNEAALNDVLNSVYPFYVKAGLDALAAGRDGQVVGVSSDDPGITTTSIVFVSDTNPDAHLSVTLNIPTSGLPFEVLAQTNDALTVVPKASEPRFFISEWRQWQTPVQLKGEHELWDPLGGDIPPPNPDAPEDGDIFNVHE